MLCLRGFILYSRERAWVFLKTILVIFKIPFRLRDRHVFEWQPLEILNVFTTLIFKLIFWETKIFFKKLEYRFLVQNAIFPHKTALPEANVKTNRMGNTKCTYHERQSFASNYFIFFLKIFFQSINLYLRVD